MEKDKVHLIKIKKKGCSSCLQFISFENGKIKLVVIGNNGTEEFRNESVFYSINNFKIVCEEIINSKIIVPLNTSYTRTFENNNYIESIKINIFKNKLGSKHIYFIYSDKFDNEFGMTLKKKDLVKILDHIYNYEKE